MIQLPESLRARLMLIHGCTTVALGLMLLYVSGTMTNLLFDLFGGAIAMLLLAASLLFIASVDWIVAGGFGRHEIRTPRITLAITTVVAACGVLLLLYPGGTIQVWCCLIAMYALCLSVAKVGLARSWQGSKRGRLVMYVLAAIGFAFSAGLAAVTGQGERRCLAVVAAYSIFLGLQMLLTIYFLQKQQRQNLSDLRFAASYHRHHR
jgi:hypothetical protein